jgi:hypothetical protein
VTPSRYRKSVAGNPPPTVRAPVLDPTNKVNGHRNFRLERKHPGRFSIRGGRRVVCSFALETVAASVAGDGWLDRYLLLGRRGNGRLGCGLPDVLVRLSREGAGRVGECVPARGPVLLERRRVYQLP